MFYIAPIVLIGFAGLPDCVVVAENEAAGSISYILSKDRLLIDARDKAITGFYHCRGYDFKGEPHTQAGRF